MNNSTRHYEKLIDASIRKLNQEMDHCEKIINDTLQDLNLGTPIMNYDTPLYEEIIRNTLHELKKPDKSVTYKQCEKIHELATQLYCELVVAVVNNTQSIVLDRDYYRQLTGTAYAAAHFFVTHTPLYHPTTSLSPCTTHNHQ